jgi:hypothetical protein
MASHHAFELPPALRSNGRPKTPLVNIALVRPTVKAPARKPWSQPQVDDKGFIPPKALRPQDFEEPSAFPMRRLLALVSGVSWIRQADILSARRQANTVKARQIVFWLAKKFTGLSFPQISRRIGDRDHTTVLYGVRRVQSVIDRLNIEVTECPVEMAERLWAAEWPRVLK